MLIGMHIVLSRAVGLKLKRVSWLARNVLTGMLVTLSKVVGLKLKQSSRIARIGLVDMLVTSLRTNRPEAEESTSALFVIESLR